MLGVLIRGIISSYLPGQVTQPLLRIIHTFLPLPLPLHIPVLTQPPPRPGTPAYVQHFRILFVIISLGAFIATLTPSPSPSEYNFYQLLGIPPGADEALLKSAFRMWARTHHPDRSGDDTLFRQGRAGYEVLRDPVLRFAYERFGPDALEWTGCSTPREYLRTGLMRAGGYHLFTGLGLIFFSIVSGRSSVDFWRYLLFIGLLVLELALVLQPSPTVSAPPVPSLPGNIMGFIPNLLNAPFDAMGILFALFPSRVVYQHVRFLHQLFILASVLLGRVVPVLFPSSTKEGTEAEIRGLVERLNAIGGIADREVVQMLDTTLRAVDGLPKDDAVSLEEQSRKEEKDAQAMEVLTREMENMLIERRLKQEATNGPLRAVWEDAVRDENKTEEVQKEQPLSTSGKLPSPPPEIALRRGQSYVRARSVSC